jgi:hypothetical protein
MEPTEVVTTVEPTIVESTPSEAQIVEQSTPMDSNVTYNNIQEAEYQSNMDLSQNMLNDAVHVAYQNQMNVNTGKAMNNFLTNKYDYNKNEAGTYWVAGAINDNNTQMSFLQTLINEEMYDEMDLHKYYYDTNLATARAYAAQKNKEVAHGFYRAAQEKALTEAELTGWYMPAEGQYLLNQYNIAQEVLANEDSTVEQLAKANRVSKTAEEWFAANQITTRGIKCLSMMQYEESYRHMNAMAELKKQANAIASSQNAASKRIADLQFRDWVFDLEEYELASGHNITKELGIDDKDVLGHAREDYKGYDALPEFKKRTVTVPVMDEDGNFLDAEGNIIDQSQKDWKDKRSFKQVEISALADLLYNSNSYYSSVINTIGSESANKILKANGLDPTESFRKYTNDQSLANMKTEISASGSITSENAAFQTTGKKDHDGNEIKYTVVGNKVVVGYWDDGVWVPITDEKAAFSDDKSIKTYIENKFGKGSMSTKKITSISIDGETYSFGRGSSASYSHSATTLYDLGYVPVALNNEDRYEVYNLESATGPAKKVEEVIRKSQSEEGYEGVRNLTYKYGYIDKKNVNEFVILEGEDGEYYTVIVEGINGDAKLKKLDSHNIKKVGKVADHYKVGDTWDVAVDYFSGDSEKEEIAKTSWYMGSKDGLHYMYLPQEDKVVSVKYKYDDSGEWTERFQSGTEFYEVVSLNVSNSELEKANIKVPVAMRDGETAEGSYNGNSNVINAEDLLNDATANAGSSSSSSGASGASADVDANVKVEEDAKYDTYNPGDSSESEYSGGGRRDTLEGDYSGGGRRDSGADLVNDINDVENKKGGRRG